MAANTMPIFPLTPKIQWSGILTIKNTSRTGTGDAEICFEAGINGSRIDMIKVYSVGTNIATVLRLFINNGNSSEVAANNTLAYEYSVPASTASETTALPDRDLIEPRGSYEWGVPIPFLPPHYRILATIGMDIAAGIIVTVFGGDY